MGISELVSYLQSIPCSIRVVDGIRLIVKCDVDIDLSRFDLSNFREIRIVESPLSNIDFLRGAHNLRILDIHSTCVRDISVIGYLKNIEYLDISLTLVEDISALSKAENLRELHLVGLNIRSVEPIRSLKKLRRLSLDFCYSVKDISPLADLPELEYLSIAHTNVDNIDPLIENAKKYGKLRFVNVTDSLVGTESITELLRYGVHVEFRKEEFGPRL